ncbi:MAG: hypothetical protein SFX18_13005 [Pirellulales bacterium]|nr:hypothetical protein [Pirellulales bacterium]
MSSARTNLDTASLLELAARYFHQQANYHDLFQIRLMQVRTKLGLPAVATSQAEELPAPQRQALEAAYLEVCEEVGQLWLAAGNPRAAWSYLRLGGQREPVARKLRETPVTSENLDELLELALSEQIAPAYGLRLILDHFGVCQAITAFDSELAQASPRERELAANDLVARLHADLLATLGEEITRREPSFTLANADTLSTLLHDRQWLFADNAYHLDTTHLSSVVRIARWVADPRYLKLARELCQYGQHLSAQLQLAGDPPFTDNYRAHELFFAAQLGENIDQALAYFEQAAAQTDSPYDLTLPAETYIVLLTRLRRWPQALAAAARWFPPGQRTSGFAPTLVELSNLAGDYAPLCAASRERGDVLHFVVGLLGG